MNGKMCAPTCMHVKSVFDFLPNDVMYVGKLS